MNIVLSCTVATFQRVIRQKQSNTSFLYLWAVAAGFRTKMVVVHFNRAVNWSVLTIDLNLAEKHKSTGFFSLFKNMAQRKNISGHRRTNDAFHWFLKGKGKSWTFLQMFPLSDSKERKRSAHLFFKILFLYKTYFWKDFSFNFVFLKHVFSFSSHYIDFCNEFAGKASPLRTFACGLCLCTSCFSSISSPCTFYIKVFLFLNVILTSVAHL